MCKNSLYFVNFVTRFVIRSHLTNDTDDIEMEETAQCKSKGIAALNPSFRNYSKNIVKSKIGSGNSPYFSITL